jgi:hypothetical protein
MVLMCAFKDLRIISVFCLEGIWRHGASYQKKKKSNTSGETLCERTVDLW